MIRRAVSDRRRRGLEQRRRGPDLALVDIAEARIETVAHEMRAPLTAIVGALRLLPGHAALPIIFMTALGRPRQADLLRGRDACGVIAKPFDPLTLPANIRALLDRRPQY